MSRAREGGAEPRLLYFQTWGRRYGDAQNCDYYPLTCTFEGHTDALRDGYELYADATQGEIAAVGFAWRRVREDPAAPIDPLSLWTGDDSHPSLRGSYLSAALIFAELFGVDPSNSSFDGGLPAGEAAYLRGVAALEAG